MIRLTLAFALSTLACSAPARPPAHADRVALQKLADDADAAWNDRDAAAMLAAYAPDPSLRVGTESEALSGAGAIGSFFAAAFGRREGEFRHLTKVDGIDMVDADQALSEATVRVERRTSGGEWVLARKFRSLSLAVRTARGWKLRWVRAIPLS